ncbi:hypothetical protein K501DRAFT_262534 [Backusella circina FSU 941]|nr:hypothetical protein K501DRAFT_262534 [Backusella circina FSU 941]
MIYVDRKGMELEHTEATPKWACLVCRGLCECKSCQPVKSNNSDEMGGKNNHTNTANSSIFDASYFSKDKKESTNRLSTKKEYELPTLSPITLLYPEQDIWVRLQIREWMHRFGDMHDFDQRIISLQNVQSDWRAKRLGAHVVWKVFMIAKKGGLLLDDKVIQMTKDIMQDWIKEKRLARLVTSEQAIHQALSDVMARDGVSPRRWQELAEVLACAGYTDLPVPTMASQKVVKEEDMDIDDDEEEIENEIKRYQTDTRSSHLMSLSDELGMINMLLELLLFDSKTRQSLAEVPKELREFETEIKKERKQHAIEDLKKKSHRNALIHRISHLQQVKGGDVAPLETELDELETAIRDEQLAMETRELDFIKQNLRAQKRFAPIGTDTFGNHYWTFSDLVDHTSNASYSRNNEPFWAFGIIVIGPGYQQETAERWWHISGIKEMIKLERWLLSFPKEETKDFLIHLRRHVQYLKSLEWVAYGEGFFS